MDGEEVGSGKRQPVVYITTETVSCWERIDSAYRCGVLLLIQRILTIFCRPFQRSCAGSAKWARSTAGTRNYVGGLQTTPVHATSPPTFLSKPGRPSTCKPWSRSPALPFRRKPVRSGQFPKPSSVGCQIFHLTCPQQGPLCSLMPQTHQQSSPSQCSVHRYRLLLTERVPWPGAVIDM